MHRLVRTIASGVILTGSLAAVPFAATETSAMDPPATNSAMEELRRMAEYLAQADQFSVTQRSGYDAVQESGQ